MTIRLNELFLIFIVATPSLAAARFITDETGFISATTQPAAETGDQLGEKSHASEPEQPR